MNLLFHQTFQRLKNANIKIKAALSGDDKLITQLSKTLDFKFKKINIDAKFFIVDKEQILFYVSKNPEEEIAVWINSEFFSNSFATFG